MKTVLRCLFWSGLLLAASCVTINIYFPAEEIRGAADRIVNEVWSERPSDTPPPAQPENPGSSMLNFFGPTLAYAAQDVDVSTPEIRALKASMKLRADQLFPYLDAGQVGIANNGLLELRSTEGLDLRSRAAATRLVQAENDDRLRLYREIAKANGFPEKTAEVQAIFADSWRDQARSGWYIETADGAWVRK